jgi:hypothetical protein
MINDPREVLGRQNWWRFVREMGIRFTYGDDDDGIFRVVVYALGRRGERERRGEESEMNERQQSHRRERERER